VRNLLILFLLSSVLIDQSCYPVRAYRLASPVVTIDNGITLAFIEFDDNGELYDERKDANDLKSILERKELDQTIQKIQDLKESNKATGINVVVFVHGWKNNAGDSNNVAGFQAFLRQIHNSYADDQQRAPLMGIYIGWRGASVRVAKNFSYWSRTNAALRVAGPHMEEALYRIIHAVKSSQTGLTRSASIPEPKDSQSVDQTQTSNLILIGHSFGARVVEKAMTSYFENKILDFDGKHLQGCIAPPGSGADKGRLTKEGQIVSGWQRQTPDLTVLLNEAAPATHAKQFLEFLKCHGTVLLRAGEHFPLFLSITSDGDAATSIALPIGQAVARIELKTRAYGGSSDPPEIANQSTYYTHSAANIPALHSHELRSGPCLDGEKAVPFAKSILDRYSLCEVHYSGSTPYWNHTPYWITKIPVSIVPDHSDIFHPELYGFLSAFLPDKESLRSPMNPPVQRTRTLSVQ